ncbi:MAG: sugar ABC transporter ATP-binding protein [Eubacterium sp.]|nr:sugar ABC transporter ATP-binding protein [Eubacterium sp.]
MENICLKVEHISKSYPGVQALSDISLTIAPGEIRAFLGENGAGKSTLIKIIMGVEKADSGTVSINVDGEWKVPHSVEEARAYGMQANYQNVNIARELSIAENYFLGNIPKTKFGAVDWKTMYAESRKIIDRFEMGVNPRDRISELPIAMQEMVTISKISVNENLRLVIFDEPTALLENEKVEILYRYIRELKSAGVSIIYISHRIEELMEICDTVTILKDGQYVATKNISEVNKDMLISMMVGREVTDLYGIERFPFGDEVLRCEHLTRQGVFEDVSFSVRAGEILGFAGLVGAGRSEVMRALFGVDRLDAGEIYIEGEKVRIRQPLDAMKKGIGFLTEDRRVDGLAVTLSVKTNVNMYSYDMISRAGFINLRKEKSRAEEYREKVQIKTPSVEQSVSNLSGGNQQKVVVAKLLCRDPKVLIFDEPTVGVDVGAKQEIYKIMEDLTRQGKAIILISSYLPEVMGLSDRLVVMAEGRVTKELDNKEIQTASEEDILRLASIAD